MIAITGRGVINILQGIIGVVFAMEGFWGAVKYEIHTVKQVNGGEREGDEWGPVGR